MGGKRNIMCGKNRTFKSGFLFQGLHDIGCTEGQSKCTLRTKLATPCLLNPRNDLSQSRRERRESTLSNNAQRVASWHNWRRTSDVERKRYSRCEFPIQHLSALPNSVRKQGRAGAAELIYDARGWIQRNAHSRADRRLDGFLGLSLNGRTILFLVILLDKTVSVGWDSLCIMTLALSNNRDAVTLKVLLRLFKHGCRGTMPNFLFDNFYYLDLSTKCSPPVIQLFFDDV